MAGSVSRAAGSPPASRFRVAPPGEPFRLRQAPPHAYGYAWRHRSPSASLVLAHGLQSHAGWFAESAARLHERGLSVYALDRRGSGSSPEDPGHVPDYRVWIQEVSDTVRVAREEGGAPVHLLGHCFGANLALGAALASPGDVASLTMLTPGLYVLPDYSPAQKAMILFAGMTDPYRRFTVVPEDDGLFTRDPELLASIRSDELRLRSVTAHTLLQIRRMLRWLRRHARDLRLPLLVLEAARDRVSDNARNRAFLDRELGEGCRWITTDAEHFLLLESCRDQVLDHLVEWISGRAAQR